MPAYRDMLGAGELDHRIALLEERMHRCDLCPRRCRVDRMAGERGHCRSGSLPVVSAASAHFGEERCLVGSGGSGTIFFTHCNLDCLFCQNADISHLGRGEEISYEELARMMISLQKRGCHNINLVTPTHMVYAILRALKEALAGGLRLPLVYNTGGYDAVDTLELLDGVIDIYMPDLKYMDSRDAEELSGVPDYPAVATAAIREMHRQTGDLCINRAGVAERGLLIRHLVLPNDRARSMAAVAWVASLSHNTYLNIMDQYRPEYRARDCRGMGRRVTQDEYDAVIERARELGLRRLAS